MMRPSSLPHQAPIRPRTSRIVSDVIPPKKRPQGGPALRGAPSCHIGLRLLGLAAPIGLSLMVTSGFAAVAGPMYQLDPVQPPSDRLMRGVFPVVPGPFSCVTNSGLLDHQPDDLQAGGEGEGGEPRMTGRGQYRACPDRPQLRGRDQGMELTTRHAGFQSGATSVQGSGELGHFLRKEKSP